jgi:hypothetical protein
MAKKKRYYQSKKDRSMERKGMMERLGEEFYAGMHGRAAADRMAEGMISEDRNAIANLPQEVIMKEYPRVDYAANYDLNDNIRGVDAQMYEDSKRKKNGPYPEKY